MTSYTTKILEILKDKELTLSQIANQNNLNYESTKRALELLTQLDLIEIRLIKNKTLYSEKLKEPRYFFTLEQMLRGLELDEFGYVIAKMKQIIIEKEVKKEMKEELKNQNLREEYKELPNNSISEYLHTLGEIKEDEK